MNLSDGVLRASYRYGFDDRILLEPGRIVRIDLGPHLVYPTSNRFAVGHRIRLQIASSDYPSYDINPGHGQPAAMFEVPVAARNVIYHDAQYPSHIVLPIVPAS